MSKMAQTIIVVSVLCTCAALVYFASLGLPQRPPNEAVASPTETESTSVVSSATIADVPTATATDTAVIADAPRATDTAVATETVTTAPLSESSAEPEPITIPAGVDAIVSADLLNVRRGHSAESQVLGVVQRGTPLKIVGQTSKCEWLLIETESGTSGWVQSQFMGLSVTCEDLIARVPEPSPTAAATVATQSAAATVAPQDTLVSIATVAPSLIPSTSVLTPTSLSIPPTDTPVPTPTSLSIQLADTPVPLSTTISIQPADTPVPRPTPTQLSIQPADTPVPRPTPQPAPPTVPFVPQLQITAAILVPNLSSPALSTAVAPSLNNLNIIEVATPQSGGISTTP